MKLRTYIPEPRRVHPRRWIDKPAEHHTAVVNNRCDHVKPEETTDTVGNAYPKHH